MLFKSLKLTNFLSFGESSQALELRPLNVVIGPNGSGKSNLIEAIDLIRSSPSTSDKSNLLAAIRDGGGVRDWLWKGADKSPYAAIDAVFGNPNGPTDLRYVLSFCEIGQRFEIIDERIENAAPDPKKKMSNPYFYYKFQNGHGVLNIKGKKRRLQHEDINQTASILSQRKDPDQYPELTYLGNTFGKMRLYREWSFGRNTAPRLPQKADLPNEFLEPDSSNLGLVLNRLRRDPAVKKKLLHALRALYDGIDDFDIQIEGGTVQVFFQEGKYIVPATRLSDGTLRYLCLLAILCHPNPPPLICIEEPELGLHPDVLPTLANLLKDASERTQLIVTTHSDGLVDALTDQPEAVIVAERGPQGTTLTRLDVEKLKPWLEKYRLGQLWTRGEIGGTRW
ncbi:AAA family ATPase [Xanthomonas melonis]|uniref:AAA family ATPase n=1 Tax=Xanthomonas melonis TaxID=56456 RepID=A0ABS8NQK3_9XANT|nr:AAA family ATPase [Xanthomonas melonis]MCD0244847.1 AAA family ATPase [Xanthomonas melonis]MCD0257078.1 AAA family ATPase [Xanthomonas melonis]MCD0265340.1 AAA family ATPase [Xanthomonas melonis]